MDGTCGAGHSSMACGGSHPGCCSSSGYCGLGLEYCNKNQQKGFGGTSSSGSSKDPCRSLLNPGMTCAQLESECYASSDMRSLLELIYC
jgi:hypothetical protein